MQEFDIKRKKGAPRKIFTREDTPRDIHTKVKTSVFNLIPAGRPINEVLEELLTAAYANREQKDLIETRKKVQKLEYELAKARIELHNIEEGMKQQRELQRAIAMQRKYLGAALRIIIKKSWGSRKVTTKQEWLEKLYGISFDIPALDKILADTSISSVDRITDMPDLELIEAVSARKLNTGEKEAEIMQTIKVAHEDILGKGEE